VVKLHPGTLQNIFPNNNSGLPLSCPEKKRRKNQKLRKIHIDPSFTTSPQIHLFFVMIPLQFEEIQKRIQINSDKGSISNQFYKVFG
jgi:hypothetical protein